MFGQHEIELQLEVLELLVRVQPPAPATAFASDEDAVFDFPRRSGRRWGCCGARAGRRRRSGWGARAAPATGGHRPAGQILSVEQLFPRSRRLRLRSARSRQHPVATRSRTRATLCQNQPSISSANPPGAVPSIVQHGFTWQEMFEKNAMFEKPGPTIYDVALSDNGERDDTMVDSGRALLRGSMACLLGVAWTGPVRRGQAQTWRRSTERISGWTVGGAGAPARSAAPASAAPQQPQREDVESRKQASLIGGEGSRSGGLKDSNKRFKELERSWSSISC